MTIDQMARAISIHREAAALKKKFDEYVLIKPDAGCKPEVINVGDPIGYRKDAYHRTEIAITDDLRRIAFRQWRKGIALKFNEHVRELNMLGATHEFRLIGFSSVTGEPQS